PLHRSTILPYTTLFRSSRGREGDIGTSAVINDASPITSFLFDIERMQHLILEPSRAEAVNLQVIEVDAVHLLRPILDAARSAGRQVLDDIGLVVLVVPEAGGGSDRRLEAKRERASLRRRLRLRLRLRLAFLIGLQERGDILVQPVSIVAEPR